MEHHGHLQLDSVVRSRLLDISAATIDRLLGLVGCSLSKPVRYWRRVSALGPWVKCTRSGAKNSASSGRGSRGACGNRARLRFLRLILAGYRRFTGPDKVVLSENTKRSVL